MLENSKSNSSEIKKISFWISQLAIILSTVIGVYLASSEGFKQAMSFSDLSAMKSNYYLRNSIYSEIQSNIKNIENYDVRLREGYLEQPKFNRFVWDSLKYSPNTLETPSEIIVKISQFYETMHSLVSNTQIGSSLKSQELLKLAEDAKLDLIPLLEKDTTSLKTTLLKQYKVKI